MRYSKWCMVHRKPKFFFVQHKHSLWQTFLFMSLTVLKHFFYSFFFNWSEVKDASKTFIALKQYHRSITIWNWKGRYISACWSVCLSQAHIRPYIMYPKSTNAYVYLKDTDDFVSSRLLFSFSFSFSFFWYFTGQVKKKFALLT